MDLKNDVTDLTACIAFRCSKVPRMECLHMEALLLSEVSPPTSRIIGFAHLYAFDTLHESYLRTAQEVSPDVFEVVKTGMQYIGRGARYLTVLETIHVDPAYDTVQKRVSFIHSLPVLLQQLSVRHAFCFQASVVKRTRPAVQEKIIDWLADVGYYFIYGDTAGLTIIRS